MTRISTNMMYDLGAGAIQHQYADLMKAQQQLATGRRILTPSDDPIASSRALEVTQSMSANDQFITNSQNAQSSLEMEESVLSSVTSLLQDVRTIVVNSGDATLNSSDRASLATELKGRYQQLLALANATDGNGQYMFSGYRGRTLPFAESGTGNVVYNGDQGQRLLQINASRQIPVSNSGAEVFQMIKEGNGTFVTAANYTALPVNTGSGVISPGIVLDPVKWNLPANNKNFTIKFDVTGGVTTYDLVDNVSGNSLLTGAPAAAAGPYARTYTNGSIISLKSQGAEPPFDFGAQLTIAGQPATGDTFTVKASKTNQDVFSTLNSMINALSTVSSDARRINELNTGLQNIDQAMDNVLGVRASIGASMKEVEAQTVTNDELSMQYKTNLSELQDLDYAKGVSDLSLRQAGLEAAQKSFMRVQSLSLFNYMS